MWPAIPLTEVRRKDQFARANPLGPDGLPLDGVRLQLPRWSVITRCQPADFEVLIMVRIEFYGLARRRAGRAWLDVEGESIADALRAAVAACPPLADCCTPEGRPRTGFIVNLSGRRFVSDPAERLSPGESLLLLSADAGG